MKNTRLALAVASAMTLTATSEAANIDVTLTAVKYGLAGGEGFAAFEGAISGTTSGSFNTSTGIVTMNLGATSMGLDASALPNNAYFIDTHTNWSTGAGGYSASGFSCSDTTYGPSIGGSICGSYNYGGNFINDSSVNYNAIPGTRSLGGDDVALATSPISPFSGQHQGSDYATSVAIFGGGQLIMQSALWNSSGPAGQSTAGVQLIFETAVPIPAAVWLFGSALGLLGRMRRKRN